MAPLRNVQRIIAKQAALAPVPARKAAGAKIVVGDLTDWLAAIAPKWHASHQLVTAPMQANDGALDVRQKKQTF